MNSSWTVTTTPWVWRLRDHKDPPADAPCTCHIFGHHDASFLPFYHLRHWPTSEHHPGSPPPTPYEDIRGYRMRNNLHDSGSVISSPATRYHPYGFATSWRPNTFSNITSSEKTHEGKWQHRVREAYSRGQLRPWVCLGRQKPVPEDVFLEFDALEQLLL